MHGSHAANPREKQNTGARDPALRPKVRELQFAGAKLESQIVVWKVSGGARTKNHTYYYYY